MPIILYFPIILIILTHADACMFLINSGIWGKSACYGSIRLVKLVWMLLTRAYNVPPGAKI